MHSWLTDERKTVRFIPTVHRISRGECRVALLRCPVYAAYNLLTVFWLIIPFTLIYFHTQQHGAVLDIQDKYSAAKKDELLDWLKSDFK